MDVRQDIRLYPPPDAVSGIQTGPKKQKPLRFLISVRVAPSFLGPCFQITYP